MHALYPSSILLSYTRFVVNLILFISLVLLATLLSGATSPAKSVSSVYLVKLSYEDIQVQTLSTQYLGSPTSSGSAIPGTSSSSIATSMTVESITRASLKPTSVTELDQTTIPDPTRNQFATGTSAKGDSTFSNLPRSSRARSKLSQSRRQPSSSNVNPLAAPILTKRNLETLAIQTNSLQLDVLIGYFGFCAVRNDSSPMKCLNSRQKSMDDLPDRLFPMIPNNLNPGPGQQNTSLGFQSDPQDLIGLGWGLQRAISPVPLVGALIFNMCAWLTSLYVTLFKRGQMLVGSGSGGVARIGGNTVGLNRIRDKLIFGLLVATVFFTLIGVTFLKAAANVANEILNSSEPISLLGENGVSTGLVRLKATPGWLAIRIGFAALALIGMTTIGVGVALALNRHDEQEFGNEANYTGGSMNEVFSKLCKKKQDMHDNIKMKISHPIPFRTNEPNASRFSQDTSDSLERKNFRNIKISGPVNLGIRRCNMV